jgi:hypothetical protein
MADLGRDGKENRMVINEIGVTGDTLSSRGGLSIFVRYIQQIGILSILDGLFGSIRKSGKGRNVAEIFRQILCFLVDGTSHHLVRFDSLKRDAGYAATIECGCADLLSSHSVKRFFRAFSWGYTWAFRKVLLRLFLWRLGITQPATIELGIDTMVMDNDEARKREGVHRTYKRVKGFHPLQMTWGHFPIDAIFRGGTKHGNHGDGVEQMVKRIVKAIREGYREDVPIIIRMDAGFFDQDLFELSDKLGVGFTCSGKLYQDIREYVDSLDKDSWGRYESGNRGWDYVEFGDRRGRWKSFRRAIFTRLDDEERQLVLEFARMESLIYTNLGMGGKIDELLLLAGESGWSEPAKIIQTHHGRGRDELVHRSLKEFGPEALPFRRFSYNTAFYYTMLLGLFLFESFKEDVTSEAVPVTSYPNTVRRTVIDFAAKIVKSGKRRIMKVTQSICDDLHLPRLWQKAGEAVPIQLE